MKKIIKIFKKWIYWKIYIIHKILGLPKNHLNYLKDSIFDVFLRNIIGF